MTAASGQGKTGSRRSGNAAYLLAKRIKQGQSRLDPAYAAFAEGLRERYGITPLAVALDVIARPQRQGTALRLIVVLERTDQYRLFAPTPYVMDKAKQKAIAGLFTQTQRGTDLIAKSGLSMAPGSADDATIVVHFQDFERLAKLEAHDLAVRHGLDEFTARLGIGNQFWCTERLDGPPIVFVHTEDQARTVRASALPEGWADTYFEIAKRYDGFGYLSRHEITIRVDSKEHFEASYSGNWFYYFK